MRVSRSEAVIALTLFGAILWQAGAARANERALGSGNAAKEGSRVDSGFAQEPQPIYSLPADHRYHRGSFYKKNDYTEWQYFTVLGKDLDSGDDISLFICNFNYGWNNGIQAPVSVLNFAFHNQNTGEFKAAVTRYKSKMKGKGTNPNAKDFRFSYSNTDDDASLLLAYDYKTETWTWKGYSDVDAGDKVSYAFDGMLTVEKPGYIPAAYHGLENIGYHPAYAHNPQTMSGLTRYILAPKGTFEGTIEVDGVSYRVKGDAWYEHQWGNYRSVEQNRYFWGYMRMNDGRVFTWRQYYKGAGFEEFDAGMTRFLLVNTDGSLKFAFGPSFTYVPTEFWTSPATGKRFPWYGEMQTPLGKFYFGPKWPEQESPTFNPENAFIEGVAYIRSESPEGPIVGTGFVELVDSPREGFPESRELPEEDLLLNIGGMNR
jgi:hypothetical protein